MKYFTRLLIFLLILMLSMPVLGASVKIFDTEGRPKGINIAEDGNIKTYPEFQSLIPADYYLYKTVATPVITTTVTIGDEVIQVVSSTGVVTGHVITFYEGNNMFQSLVTATTATTISVASFIDFAFTSASLIEAGLWSMNVDGSAVAQVFSIKAPPLASIDIHTINCSMLSTTVMGDGLFGGIPALTNGILFRYTDGIIKNLAVIVNNLGMWEIGFEIEYSLKPPAGQYGFRARRFVTLINGVTVKLTAGGLSEFQIHIRDNLTDLDLFATTINGNLFVNE